MNGQPVIIQGYYMHYKNKVYRLMEFATTDNDFKSGKKEFKNDDLVIYQPQYKTPDLPKYIFWARPTEMFFENMSDRTPRFRYLGRSEEEVKQMIKQNKIDTKPFFKKESMLDKGIAELVYDYYAIQGFAIHSETLNTQILYNKNGISKLQTLPENEFFRLSGIDPKDAVLSKYLKEINEAKKFL